MLDFKHNLRYLKRNLCRIQVELLYNSAPGLKNTQKQVSCAGKFQPYPLAVGQPELILKENLTWLRHHVKFN